jgi:hypothetical protein
MPTVTLSLRSQHSKPVPDRVKFVEVRGRLSGPVHPSDIDLRSDEIVMDLVPDHYTTELHIDGFKPARGKFQVRSQAMARALTLDNHVSRMPKASELEKEQRRLLQTLDATKTPGEIWDSLTDNKAATFFQITYALAKITLADGSSLSETVDQIVRLGGSELTAPDTHGTSRSVIGWRMHVLFVGGAAIETTLEKAALKRDGGEAHPTHRRFGFVRSFRERKGQPRLQVVTNHEGSGADVDLDTGAFHKSSPQHVFKGFAKRFPEAVSIYKVKS